VAFSQRFLLGEDKKGLYLGPKALCKVTIHVYHADAMVFP